MLLNPSQRACIQRRRLNFLCKIRETLLVPEKDWGYPLWFHDFPAEYWVHIRTLNPSESTFGTVRYRMRRTKGCGSRFATLKMVFRLLPEAEKTWKW
jgi:transposase-like protein